MAPNERVTKVGCVEKIGEAKWQSPYHQTEQWKTGADGKERRVWRAGIRTGAVPQPKTPLTDRKIDAYVQTGTYEMRGDWRKQEAEDRRIRGLLPRLVYDTVNQTFRDAW